MSEFEPKTGMWKCRDGRYVCVWHIVPKWARTKWFIQGFNTDGYFTSWKADGRESIDHESECDLIEHLSDEIADPRTWKPPVKLKEGVWEFDDGSRGVVQKLRESWYVIFLGQLIVQTFWIGPLSGMVETGTGDELRPTRFIGPLPTGEE